ncbi:transcription cofactor HES-6 isoform X2 [Rhineura floridana]|uniref:transcription cofactor HES-6 isoform X2 n=1 Tax=Rhineura floridana TaxID=261503 RepID=UPI002AC87898|nr:transcription cofactor HES-6 isoform X2 [Rhineura floridana]
MQFACYLWSGMEISQLRKPLIERKRRERINNCLDQLKETVVGAFQLDQSKLEKADILEMTVKHLQNIQNSKVVGTDEETRLRDPFTDSKMGLEAQQRYSTGYIQCMHEVHNLLLTCEWMDKTLGARLLNHLLKSLPRSSEETCKADLSSTTPGNSKENITGSNQSQDQFHPAEDKQGLKKPFQPQTPSCGSWLELSPPSQILQSHFAHNGISMGSLDMWRPW